MTCFTILFTELFLIRLISTEINIFAYLQNSILIVCFLGLGMGLYRGKGGPSIDKAILPLCILTLLCLVPMTRIGLNVVSQTLSFFHDFVVWAEFDPTKPRSFPQILAIAGAIGVVLFVSSLCWSVMTPFGVQLGTLLADAPHPLRAYSWDIAGSALGIVCFTSLSFCSTSPLIWFCVLALLLLTWAPNRSPRSLLVLGVTVLTATIFSLDDRRSQTLTVWSPYQKLTAVPSEEPREWVISTNNSGFQQIQDNVDDTNNGEPILHQYSIPALLAQNPKRALIVGAGTGNDLAGVLRHSQADVVAVEIDPELVKIGRRLHPERPFENPRVTLMVDDARAAFEKLAPMSFDLIVFGLLDSHTTPNLSNARLDNFVYTVQSFEAAKQLLSERGVIVVIFEPQRPYIAGRLYNTLSGAFGNPPRTLRIPTSAWGCGGTVFIAGNRAVIEEQLAQQLRIAEYVESHTIELSGLSVAPTTDRWPYLYIEKPSIPILFYFLGLLLIVLWCRASSSMFGTLRFPGLRTRSDLRFFFLGVGFSAAQVFAVNNASVLFGSTWVVNSSVIFGTLALILCANFLTLLVPNISTRLLGLILVCVCLGLAALPLSLLLGAPFLQKFFGGALVSGLPMLLSGLIFARAFDNCDNRSEALGANLLGAMVGGILQLGTFLWGIPSLMLCSALAYALVAALGDPATSSHRLQQRS